MVILHWKKTERERWSSFTEKKQRERAERERWSSFTGKKREREREMVILH